MQDPVQKHDLWIFRSAVKTGYLLHGFCRACRSKTLASNTTRDTQLSISSRPHTNSYPYFTDLFSTNCVKIFICLLTKMSKRDGPEVTEALVKSTPTEAPQQSTHEDLVRSMTEQVLAREIPWEGYQRANLINNRELDLIKKYDKKSEEVRRSLISQVSVISIFFEDPN